MGEYYYFEQRLVDGEIRFGFIYSNKSTGWNEIFVEATKEQAEWANEWLEKSQDMEQERIDMVKSWVNVSH